MTNLASPKRNHTVQINDRTIRAQPRETILQAALRSGIELPSNCRVGGCGSCKCRLQQGQVTELTETAYLLAADEIDQGYILACQSVPRSDVRIEVDLSGKDSRHKVRGRIVGQEKLTHDITRLSVALEGPLQYRTGQHASLEIDGMKGVVRSYSFATPPGDDGRVVFFVRKVPGGKLSSLVNDEDLVGRGVEVDGPSGDFWLRPSDAPLLLVAGGSGLAPILAIIKEALAADSSRSVTLLFGVREEKDLYALDEIDALARAWRGSFRFLPVLSAASDGATWRGERGLVTDKMPGLIEPGAHAYLCGPPAMIDSALPFLKAQGVPRDHVHFDRFTTQAEAAVGYGAPDDVEGDRGAGTLHYLKYFLFHAVGLYSLAVASLGLNTTVATLGLLAFILLGDALCGEDTSSPRFKHSGLLTAQLWLALPMLALFVFMSVWAACSGDPLGVGAFLTRLTGRDALAARDAISFGDVVSRWLGTGLLIGMVGTITAHELTHRTWDKVSMFVGRWLLAFSFDTAFAIEHVYGHHRYVATSEDPATAPRGRGVYFHVVSSTIRGNLSAWRIETERLKRKRLPVLSWHNAFLRGQLMSAALLLAAFAMGGWKAAAFFVLCGLWAKALLEIVNYMEHYGMVRNPARPVQPRHSWNTNKRISSWMMFNLTRHSHHHAQGEVPYQNLKPYPNAPMMINGYLATIVLALIPPLWKALMTPKLLAWDRDYASEEERVLAAGANARSGIGALQAHG